MYTPPKTVVRMGAVLVPAAAVVGYAIAMAMQRNRTHYLKFVMAAALIAAAVVAVEIWRDRRNGQPVVEEMPADDEVTV